MSGIYWSIGFSATRMLALVHLVAFLASRISSAKQLSRHALENICHQKATVAHQSPTTYFPHLLHTSATTKRGTWVSVRCAVDPLRGSASRSEKRLVERSKGSKALHVSIFSSKQIRKKKKVFVFWGLIGRPNAGSFI